MGVLLRNSGVQMVWGLWKNKYLKKGIAYCTFHITPLFSRSYKCLTVEHMPSDFRHLEERFKVCWRQALWGTIFPRAAHKYEPELPIGANQQISVWEDAWNASKAYKGRHNLELKYESKDDLVFIYCSYFPSWGGEIQYLLFLASFALPWIPPLLLLFSFLAPMSLAEGV